MSAFFPLGSIDQCLLSILESSKLLYLQIFPIIYSILTLSGSLIGNRLRPFHLIVLCLITSPSHFLFVSLCYIWICSSEPILQLTIFSAVSNLMLNLIIEFLISSTVSLFPEFLLFVVKSAMSYLDFLFYRYFQDFLLIYLNKVGIIILVSQVFVKLFLLPFYFPLVFTYGSSSLCYFLNLFFSIEA